MKISFVFVCCAGWLSSSVSVADLFIFFLLLSRCPLSVSIDGGRYFLTFLVVSAGHVVKLFCWIACSHVHFGGLKHARCKKVMMFFKVSCCVACWADKFAYSPSVVPCIVLFR